MSKKYISEFVKKQRVLSLRIYPRLVWNSVLQGTYVKNKHGELC